MAIKQFPSPSVETPREWIDMQDTPTRSGSASRSVGGTLPGVKKHSLFDFSLGTPVVGGSTTIGIPGLDAPSYDPDIGPNVPPVGVDTPRPDNPNFSDYFDPDAPPPVTWTSDEIIPPDLYNVLDTFQSTIEGMDFDPDDFPRMEQDENGNWVEVEEDPYYGLGFDPVASFQGQANAELQEILEGIDGDKFLLEQHKQIEENMLGGGGLGIRVNGDGSIVGIFSGGPLPGGVSEILIRDADGNIVIEDSVKNAVGKAWETVKSIPQTVADAAKKAVEELQQAGIQVGGVSTGGDIFDILGNVVGTIFTPQMEGIMSENAWLTGDVLGTILSGDWTGSEEPVSAAKGGGDDRVIPDRGVEPEIPGTPNEPPATDDQRDRTVDDRVFPGRGVEPEVVDRRDRTTDDRVFPDRQVEPDMGGEDLSDGGQGGSDDLGGGTDDGGAGGGAGGGGGRGLFNPYMGGLGYDLARPQSVLYNPTDPMQQLNQIIGRSLFGDML